jgi:hypothetical protein
LRFGHALAAGTGATGDNGQDRRAKGGGHINRGMGLVIHYGGIASNKVRRAAQACDLHASRTNTVADINSARANLAPPEDDAAKSATGTGFDDPFNRPACTGTRDVMAKGGGVERERGMISGKVTHRKGPAVSACGRLQVQDRGAGLPDRQAETPV